MIIYRRKEIKQEQFGDGTLKAIVPESLNTKSLYDLTFNFFGGATKQETITWCYDNDSEIFTLRCLVDTIRDALGKDISINLNLPYIPHARQDRRVSGRFFTLKSFANIINEMNFNQVKVLDPHSDVSMALIDRSYEMFKPIEILNISKDAVLMYPDAGAAKKYKVNNNNCIIGNKHRDESGKIIKYELLNFVEGTRSVVIVDDICSYGGTFVAAAKALKEKGVENIILIVSHCEDNILKGGVLDYVDAVYTSDSICHIKNHSKIVYIENYNFRDIDEDENEKDINKEIK